MTRWLVTGSGGMLGTDLVAALTSRGEPVTGIDRANLDVTDAAAVTDAITRYHRADEAKREITEHLQRLHRHLIKEGRPAMDPPDTRAPATINAR